MSDERLSCAKKGGAGAFHPELTPVRRWAVLVCFVFAAAISIMSQLTMTTCLPAIIAEFGIDVARAQWLTTSYMLALGIMVPCTGYLTTRFQSRHLFLVGNAVFLAGALGVFAPSFGALVAIRCVQGFAAGLFIPLMQIVAFRLFPPNRRGFAMGVAAVALAAGPVLGPTVAGVCTDVWGWRSVFGCVAALTLLSTATYPVVSALSDTTSPVPFDVASALLVAVGFSGVIAAAANVGTAGVAGVLLCLAVGAFALVLFVRRQLRIEHPLLDLRPFRNANFSLGAVAGMAVFGVLINVETFMSIYIQNDQGFSPTVAAFCLLPGTIVSALLAPFTGRILDRRGPLGLSVVGFAFLLVSGVLASLVRPASPLWYSVLAFALRCVGNACVMQNLQTWAVNSLPAGQMTHAAAIGNTLRQVGGALINALLFALMGAAAVVGGELWGIRLAFMASTLVVAGLAVAVIGYLVESRPRTR